MAAFAVRDDLSVTELLHAAQILWCDLADTASGFARDVTLVTSDRHRLSPLGWVGVVSLDSSTVVTSPSACAERVAAAIGSIESIGLGDLDRIARIVRPTRTLGPALLFFANSVGAAPGRSGVELVDFADRRVRAVLDDVTKDEWEESGIDASSTGLHLASDDEGRPGALCAWARWPHDVAHMGVLTARSQRGRGLGTAVAAQTIEAATAVGLTAQWRAATGNAASIAMARRLGFQELGWQFSLKLRES